MASGGGNDGAHNPYVWTFGSHRQSQRSVLGRPGTCVTWRAWTRAPANPRAASICTSEIQYPPVDSMAPVVLPQACSQSASRCKSQVKALNFWLGWASQSAGTQPQGSSAPIAMPAACGWMIGMFAGAGGCFLPLFALWASSPVARGESKESCCARIPLEEAHGEGRDCFSLIEPARSVGGTLTSHWSRCLTASAPASLPLPGTAEPQR